LSYTTYSLYYRTSRDNANFVFFLVIRRLTFKVEIMFRYIVSFFLFFLYQLHYFNIVTIIVYFDVNNKLLYVYEGHRSTGWFSNVLLVSKQHLCITGVLCGVRTYVRRRTIAP